MIEGFVFSDVFVATASCPFHRSQYLQFLCYSTGKKRYQKKNLTGLTRRLKPLEAGYVTQVVF